MKKVGIALVSLALAAVVGACSNRLTGSLVIDGTPFVPTACRSGQARGFSGVELTSSDARVVRLVTTPTSQAQVVLLNVGMPAVLQNCGPLTYEVQNSTVNNVRNVRGMAQIQCTDGTHTVQGAVTYENCH